jgi:hypothetical protein
MLLEQVQLNFRFRNKFIIFLRCCLLVNNNTFLKMCFFKVLLATFLSVNVSIVQPNVIPRDALRPASNNEIHMSSFSPIRTRTL